LRLASSSYGCFAAIRPGFHRTIMSAIRCATSETDIFLIEGPRHVAKSLCLSRGCFTNLVTCAWWFAGCLLVSLNPRPPATNGCPASH
jgi:hypothetical protein